jgi:hypothetical protein
MPDAPHSDSGGQEMPKKQEDPYSGDSQSRTMTDAFAGILGMSHEKSELCKGEQGIPIPAYKYFGVPFSVLRRGDACMFTKKFSSASLNSSIEYIIRLYAKDAWLSTNFTATTVETLKQYYFNGSFPDFVVANVGLHDVKALLPRNDSQNFVNYNVDPASGFINYPVELEKFMFKLMPAKDRFWMLTTAVDRFQQPQEWAYLTSDRRVALINSWAAPLARNLGFQIADGRWHGDVCL